MDIYRNITFTSFSNRSLPWLDEVIHLCRNCRSSGDAAADKLLRRATIELCRIRVLVLDAREFPELGEFMSADAVAITVSYLRVSQTFIRGGYLYVLQELVFPIASWFYNLPAQISEITFLDYLAENDPALLEFM